MKKFARTWNVVAGQLFFSSSSKNIIFHLAIFILYKRIFKIYFDGSLNFYCLHNIKQTYRKNLNSNLDVSRLSINVHVAQTLIYKAMLILLGQLWGNAITRNINIFLKLQEQLSGRITMNAAEKMFYRVIHRVSFAHAHALTHQNEF